MAYRFSVVSVFSERGKTYRKVDNIKIHLEVFFENVRITARFCKIPVNHKKTLSDSKIETFLKNIDITYTSPCALSHSKAIRDFQRSIFIDDIELHFLMHGEDNEDINTINVNLCLNHNSVQNSYINDTDYVSINDLKTPENFAHYMKHNIPIALENSTLTEHEKIQFLKDYIKKTDQGRSFYDRLHEKFNISDDITRVINHKVLPDINTILNI